jgi:hypothetical protein
MRTKEIIHKTLEGCRYVSKSKRHDNKLIVAFRDVFFLYFDLVITCTKIELGKKFGSM